MSTPRVNSTQCLRIRALECDASRLLAENLELREEILRLQANIGTAESQLHTSTVTSVKDQLEAKLHEFGLLISELGTLHTPASSTARPDALSNKRSSDSTTWRPDIPLAALSGQSDKMPEIIEETATPGGTLQYVCSSLVKACLFS